MKIKSFFCFVLAMTAIACGGVAIATSQQTAEAEGLEQISFDKSFIESTSIDRPIIDFPVLDKSADDCSDSSGLEILFPDRPNFSFIEEEEEAMPSNYCMRDEYIILAQNQDKQGY